MHARSTPSISTTFSSTFSRQPCYLTLDPFFIEFPVTPVPKPTEIRASLCIYF